MPAKNNDSTFKYQMKKKLFVKYFGFVKHYTFFTLIKKYILYQIPHHELKRIYWISTCFILIIYILNKNS